MVKIDKISLSQSRDIPFDRLVLSSRNVRHLQAGQSIEELAEDIARRTLLQSLSVRALADREGYYEVQAGGRRFRALELLVKQKRLAGNAPIPCVVREDGLLEEDSLAENVQRLNLHPLDQFRAFLSLRTQGLGDEDIAARFFVTPQIVRQRLKLASVSPVLLEVYAADEMTLEQLMVFTLTDDHARQEQVWTAVNRGYNQDAYHIRKLLTENAVRATDKRARFVGIKDYEAAGGIVLRDLFSRDEDGWLQDVALLERLVADKLTLETGKIKEEGWLWVRAAQDFPYGHTRDLRCLEGDVESLDDDVEARRDSLREEMEDIEREYGQSGDDLPEEVDHRLAEIEAALDAFEARPVRYDPADIARAGVFVSIDADGSIKVERGFIRPEDEMRVGEVDGEPHGAMDEGDSLPSTGVDSSSPGPVSANAVPGDSDADAEEDGLKPLSERLVMELTAHRTLALRNALAGDPDTAFLAVLHVLVLQTFYRYAIETCLEIAVKSSGFSVQGSEMKACASAKAIEARHGQWEKQLPENPQDLWNSLCVFDHDSRMALFAHCAALSVNAVHEQWNRAAGRKRHADQIAEAVALDMAAAGWVPTVETYLGRVPKARILEAVAEAKGSAAVEWIGHLKKSDMAEQAERLLTGTGWLPEPLRNPGSEPFAITEAVEPTASPSDLPDFLTAAE